MITATSSPKQIRRELDEDESKAHYWLMKQHGGEKGYNKWRIKFAQQAVREGKRVVVSDPVEYHSKNGNRWLSYEHVTDDGTGMGVYSFTYHVCYFETYTSIGAFVRTTSHGEDYSDGHSDGCMLFTPHFFQRFSERLGINIRSREIMLRFIQLQHSQCMLRRPPKPGTPDEQIVIRYPGSYAFGTYRRVDGYLITTVRTFLPVTMMSEARKRELAEFGEFIDKNQKKIELEHKEDGCTSILAPIYESKGLIDPKIIKKHGI